MRFSVPRALLAAGILALSAPAASGDAWPNVDPRIAPSLRSVLREAADRLASPACVALLGELSDGRTGRPLGETLARTGANAGTWLRSVWFLSGDGNPGCFGRRTFAFTSPGSPVVWICPVALERARGKRHGDVANVVIHETLHTLGLAEDPPPSEEISLRVETRCGR